MAKSEASSGGIGFTGALLILFVALKLTHNISWSWWWVLSPAWIAFGLGIVIGIPVVLLTRRRNRRIDESWAAVWRGAGRK